LPKHGIVTLVLARSAERLLKPEIWNIARLNMTTPTTMRDLALRLLAFEAVEARTSEPAESATSLVYEKLRQSLGQFAGVAGFQSLASRALALARAEAPGLSAARVTPDGYIEGFDELENQMEIDKERVGECSAGEEGIVVIARLLGLLILFLGEALTLSLLRVTWPGAAFDECSQKNGRKA
jgi:hypothetical protein